MFNLILIFLGLKKPINTDSDTAGKGYISHLFNGFLELAIDFTGEFDSVFRFTLYPKFGRPVRKGFEIKLGTRGIE